MTDKGDGELWRQVGMQHGENYVNGLLLRVLLRTVCADEATAEAFLHNLTQNDAGGVLPSALQEGYQQALKDAAIQLSLGGEPGCKAVEQELRRRMGQEPKA